MYYKNKILKVIFNKKNEFIYKVDKNYFYLLNDSIYNICNFNLLLLPNLIADIFICLICALILIIYSPLLLIVGILTIIFQIFYLAISINFQKKMFDKTTLNHNKINNLSSSYINQFNNLTNGLLINKLRNELDKNYSLSIQNNINQSIYESKLSSLKNFFGDIIYIVSVMIGIF